MSTPKKKALPPRQLQDAASLFSALGEVSRLKLLQTLQSGPHTVTELVEQTGLSQANVSKHLSALYASRLVGREKDGNFVRYHIADSIVYDLCELVCNKISRDLKNALKEL